MLIFAGRIEKLNTQKTMKKLLFTTTLALAAMTVSAQEETKNEFQLPDGILAVELQANPFSNDFKTFKMGELKARLFLNNKSALRLGVGFGMDKDTDTKSEHENTLTTTGNTDNYSVHDSETKKSRTSTALKLSLGYEYHFATTGRLDFYGGAEVGYEAKFYSGKDETSATDITVEDGVTTVSKSSTVWEFNKMMPVTSDNTPSSYTPGYSSRSYYPSYSNYKYNERSIFANIFTGVDFYIYKGLYIGTELGISFKTGKQLNGYYTYRNAVINPTENIDRIYTYSSETGLRTTIDNIREMTDVDGQENVIDHSGKTTNIKVYVEPALRLGWIF